jgi:hypothetical protein
MCFSGKELIYKRMDIQPPIEKKLSFKGGVNCGPPGPPLNPPPSMQ